ncbi:MAG: IPT/TIG domain-containing protein [Blastocatellia bacterium]
MSFQIQTQQVNTGTTATFTFPAPVGAYVYGVTAFELNAGSNPQQINTASITLTPTLTQDNTVLEIQVSTTLYESETANNWVQVTVLAWLGAENPPGIFLFNRSGLGPGASVEPVSLDGQPVLASGVIAGFDLSFSSGKSSVLGLGASCGCTLPPFASTTEAMPIGEGLLIGAGNNPSSNTVDVGIVALTESQENVAAGIYFDNNSNYGSNSCSSPNLGLAPTQVALFLQSFYMQYQITNSVDPTPAVSYIEVGATNIEGNQSGFSFTSTRELTDSAYYVTNYPYDPPEYGPIYANSYVATYLYIALAGPSTSSLSTISGPTAGGTKVTIMGTNFSDGAVVMFGTTPSDNIQVVSATEITAISPASAEAGTVDVFVGTNAGISAKNSACTFTYQSS